MITYKLNKTTTPIVSSNSANGTEYLPKFSNSKTQNKQELSTCLNSDNVHFLPTKIPLPNKAESKKSIQSENKEHYLQDIESMSMTQLRNKYKLTYDAWKNMKSRCKDGGYILDQRFNEFKDFLRHMGPRLHKKYTLDRIDCKNLTYGPDHCRWADKYTQNQNKGNNVTLTFNGETHTVSVWARKTKQNPDTLYKRIKAGWSDEEVITGKRKSSSSEDSLKLRKLEYPQLLSYFRQLLVARNNLHEMILLNIYENPEPPKELAERFNKVDSNLQILLHEIRRRNPHFSIPGEFPYWS